MSDVVAAYPRGWLDTSVIIDMPLDAAELPEASAISAITLAEFAQGPHFARTPADRAARVERLQEVESMFRSVLPFGSGEARIFGSLVALVIAAGRHPRPRRLDLMIAATAAAHEIPLFTRNATDLQGLESRVQIIAVQ